MGIRVLSLFDGIATAYQSLKELGVEVDAYYASEIDKYAIQIAMKNHPNIIQLGDVRNINAEELGGIDLLIAGSPCTQISKANTSTEGHKGLYGKDSYLFFEFVRILKLIKPKYFLLENVKMKPEYREIITNELGVNYILINSKLVSGQKRERLYWTNIPNVEQPQDKKIILENVVFSDVFPVVLHNLYGGFKEKSVRVFETKSPTIRTSKGGGHIPSLVLKDLIHLERAIEYMNRKVKDGRTHWDFAHHYDVRNEKSATIVANFFKGVPYNVFKDWNCIRKFHPIECERLQTLPDNYTEGISDTQRYKCLGNGMTNEVIKHILSYANFK